MERGKTLYDIGEDIFALDSLLFEVGGDVSEEEADTAITNWLEENQENLEYKLDGYGYLIAEQELDAAFCKAEGARLKARQKVRENAVARLKVRLTDFFTVQGLQRVDSPHYRFTLSKNGGKRPVLVSEDMNKLPDWAKWIKAETMVDTDKIRKALDDLEEGKSLPFARYEERGSHVRIK